MSEKFLRFLIAGIFIVPSGFQKVAAQSWNLSGNSNVTGSSKLGTTKAIPLGIYTSNKERVRIDTAGRVGIGTSNPVNIFTIKLNGSTPAASWLSGGSSLPAFIAFGENMATGFNLVTAANSGGYRPVLNTRRSRGTLASPTAVQNNDYLASYVSSGYDGSAFQNPATMDFYVDSTPSRGNVPARISLVTGTNSGNRKERLKVDHNGNFNFNNGQAFLQQSSGRFGIGTNSPTALLHAEGSGIAIYGNSTNGSYGVYGKSSYLGVYGIATTYGVYGSGSSYGVYGSGNYGVYGSGTTNGVYGTSYAVTSSGVYGQGTYAFGVSGNSANNYGGYFVSTNLHGIYAKTSSTNSSAYAAVFQGNTYAYGSYLTSDERVKKNISDFKSAMTLINQLKPKTYEFSSEGKYANLNLPKGNHFGLLAQDVEKLFPGLVGEAPLEVQKTPENAVSQQTGSAMPDTSALQMQPAQQVQTMKVKAINYAELIPVMIKGMQELDAENKDLKNQVTDMHDEIAGLKKLVQDLSVKVNGGNTAVSLSEASLQQNQPNPFAGKTSIPLSVPANAKSSLLTITETGSGKVLKTITVAPGTKQISVDDGYLSSGSYTYTLTVDGKKMLSRQMTVLK